MLGICIDHILKGSDSGPKRVKQDAVTQISEVLL